MSQKLKKRQEAIVALMRKLAAALWHVAQGRPFDSHLLFDVNRLSLSSTSGT